MSGDVHVRFCERLGVRLPRATHRLREAARLDNYNEWLQAEREFRLCRSLRVALRETETLAGKLVGAVSAKDWDALLQQMHAILATEGEVAVFITRLLQPDNTHGGRQEASDPVECLQGRDR